MCDASYRLKTTLSELSMSHVLVVGPDTAFQVCCRAGATCLASGIACDYMRCFDYDIIVNHTIIIIIFTANTTTKCPP
jgi:hypothetical protein